MPAEIDSTRWDSVDYKVNMKIIIKKNWAPACARVICVRVGSKIGEKERQESQQSREMARMTISEDKSMHRRDR